MGGPGSGRKPEHHFSQEYLTAKSIRDKLEQQVKSANEALKAFPKTGPIGLTPDSVKATPQYKEARSNYNKAFSQLQNLNIHISKQFPNERKLDRKFK